MELTIRVLKEADYEDILVDWWKDWNWTPPNRDFLPDNRTGGMIVYDGNTPVCAGFIYVTNSKVAGVDWIISNKKYRDRRAEAISMLVESLTNICQSNGAKFVYALLKHNGLVSTYEKLGYTAGDSYNKEMIKAL